MNRLTIEEIIEHCKRKRTTFEKVNGIEFLESKDISNTFIKEYWEHRQVAEYLSELQQYRAIGTVEEFKNCMDILNKAEADELAKIIDEWLLYRKIGTVEECRKAVEKQRAKKYERGIGKDVRCPICGTCTTDIFEHRYCSYCGQRLV